MRTEDYIHAKQDELMKWEQEIEKRGVALTESLLAKRDDVKKKLDAVKHDTSDRLDVLRMGFESAWEELKTTFETVTSKDLNSTK